MTTSRITTKDLASTVTTLGEALIAQGEQITQIHALISQQSTPTAVAETVATEVTAPAKATASDQLLAFVVEKGLALAKGGRTYQDADILKAQVRVLKTGKPEVVRYGDDTGLHKRGVTHLAIGRADDGKSTFTQFVYQPTKG